MSARTQLPAPRTTTLVRALSSLLLFTLLAIGCAAPDRTQEAKALATTASTTLYGQLGELDLARIYGDAGPDFRKTFFSPASFAESVSFLPQLGKRLKSEPTGASSAPREDGSFRVQLDYATSWAAGRTHDVLVFNVFLGKGARAVLSDLTLTLQK